MKPLHPSAALYSGEPELPSIPACEHFAGTERFIRKAFEQLASADQPFDITCDLEDGAPTGRERVHAELVGALIAELGNEQARVGLRIHDLHHETWRLDLETVLSKAGHRLSYVTVPKVHSRDDVNLVADRIYELQSRLRIEREIAIHVLIETHRGLRNVWEIAAHPLVETLDFGIMDFISEHRGAIPSHCMESPGQFTHPVLARAKTEIVAAALAHGVIPSHNVTIRFKDNDIVRRDAERARTEFGFLRMWSIHPQQITPIQEVFRPDDSEVQQAGDVLLAAAAAHWAPVQLGGTLYDRASYRYYWATLQRARAQGGALDPRVVTAFFAQAVS